MIIDKLERIHITRKNDGIHSLLLRLDCQRSQHVVGLETIFFVDGDTKCLDYCTNATELWSHVVRQLRSMGFVFGKLNVSKGWAGSIKSYRDIIRLHFSQCLQQHGRKTERRIDQLSSTGREVFGHSMKGTMNHSMPIDQHQLFSLCGLLLSSLLRVSLYFCLCHSCVSFLLVHSLNTCRGPRADQSAVGAINRPLRLCQYAIISLCATFPDAQAGT